LAIALVLLAKRPRVGLAFRTDSSSLVASRYDRLIEWHHPAIGWRGR
jgi:hypothetical protein